MLQAEKMPESCPSSDQVQKSGGEIVEAVSATLPLPAEKMPESCPSSNQVQKSGGEIVEAVSETLPLAAKKEEVIADLCPSPSKRSGVINNIKKINGGIKERYRKMMSSFRQKRNKIIACVKRLDDDSSDEGLDTVIIIQLPSSSPQLPPPQSELSSSPLLPPPQSEFPSSPQQPLACRLSLFGQQLTSSILARPPPYIERSLHSSPAGEEPPLSQSLPSSLPGQLSDLHTPQRDIGFEDQSTTNIYGESSSQVKVNEPSGSKDSKHRRRPLVPYNPNRRVGGSPRRPPSPQPLQFIMDFDSSDENSSGGYQTAQSSPDIHDADQANSYRRHKAGKAKSEGRRRRKNNDKLLWPSSSTSGAHEPKPKSE